MGEENYADYLQAIHDPATVHARCEDYRVGLGIDREHEVADLLSRSGPPTPLRITVPDHARCDHAEPVGPAGLPARRERPVAIVVAAEGGSSLYHRAGQVRSPDNRCRVADRPSSASRRRAT
jgi:hypothetical protein